MAKDADRYQILVMGLRAQKIEEAIDLDKSNRYATNLQNRLLKGINALVSLDQIESNQLGIHENTVTISAPEQADSAVTLEMPGATKASLSSSKEAKK